MAIFWKMLWYCPEYDKTSTLSLFFIRMLVFRPKLILGWKCSCIILKLHFMTFLFYPEKTADIWRRYHWFPRQMTSEKRALKFHTDDASLPRSGLCSSFWLILPRGKFASTNQATVYGEEKKNGTIYLPFLFFFTDCIGGFCGCDAGKSNNPCLY